MTKELQDWLTIGWESASRVKLGKGVVGKMTQIAIVMIVGAASIGIAAGSCLGKSALWIMAGSLVVMAVVGIGALVSMVRVACKHPDIALLEGAEFLMYHNRIPHTAKTASGVLNASVTEAQPMLSEPEDGEHE